jgi:hypothetical protein
MGEFISFLITVLYEGSLVRCAMRLRLDVLQGDCVEYPMEPANRKQLHALLPTHVRSMGPIVEVQQIFDVIDMVNT